MLGEAETAAGLPMAIVKRQLEKYVDVVRKVNGEWCVMMGFPVKDVRVDYGTRYAKVVTDHSVHSFVDTKNGDILKAGSYRAPARNGVRGNIFSEDIGKSVIDWHGTKYLR